MPLDDKIVHETIARIRRHIRMTEIIDLCDYTVQLIHRYEKLKAEVKMKTGTQKERAR